MRPALAKAVPGPRVRPGRRSLPRRRALFQSAAAGQTPLDRKPPSFMVSSRIRSGRGPSTMPLTPTLALAAVLLAQDPAVDTKFVQVAPSVKVAPPVRTPGRARAVVLLHALRPHPISGAGAQHAELS